MCLFCWLADLYVKPSFLLTQYIWVRMVPMQCKWTLPMMCIINCRGKQPPSVWIQRQGKWRENSTLYKHKCYSHSSLEYHLCSTKSQLPTFLHFYSKEFVVVKILSPQASFFILCQWKEEQTVAVGLPKMTPKPRWRVQVVSNIEPAAHLTVSDQDQVPQKSTALLIGHSFSVPTYSCNSI